MFAALLIASSAAASGGDSEVPTAAALARAVDGLRAGLKNVRAEVQTRWRQRSTPEDAFPSVAAWHEIFVAGGRVQFQEWHGPPATRDGWTAGAARGVPFTADTVGGANFYVACLRPAGDPTGMLMLPTAAAAARRSDPYDLMAWPQPEDEVANRLPDVPLLWAVRGGPSNGRVGRFLDTDPAAWVVEGLVEWGGTPAVAVRVLEHAAPPALDTADGPLTIEQPLRAYFAVTAPHDLLAVRDAYRTTLNGREIPRTFVVEPPGAVERLTDYRTAPDGARLPFAGSVEAFTAVPNPDDVRAGPEPLLAEIRETGRIHDETLYFVHTAADWRLAAVEPLDPATALWIDPPVGTYLHEVETGTERVVGRSGVASWLILTLGSRMAVWWAFGPPAALFAAAAVAWWMRRRHPGRRAG